MDKCMHLLLMHPQQSYVYRYKSRKNTICWAYLLTILQNRFCCGSFSKVISKNTLQFLYVCLLYPQKSAVLGGFTQFGRRRSHYPQQLPCQYLLCFTIWKSVIILKRLHKKDKFWVTYLHVLTCLIKGHARLFILKCSAPFQLSLHPTRLLNF